MTSLDTGTPHKESSTQWVERFKLEPDNPQRLANLAGHLDEHLKQIETRMSVKIYVRGNSFQVSSHSKKTAELASNLVQKLYRETGRQTQITPDLVHLFISESNTILAHEKSQNAMSENATEDRSASSGHAATDAAVITTPHLLIKARGPNQINYINMVQSHDINFGIGPAGTGKTYLAVACAVQALTEDRVQKILLVRPAVEAGEKLGFLPGDLSQKIDPYLRPLYDALYDMLGYEQVSKLIEKNVIEVAPLAYMRGRTLRSSFIILDESQNTTREQMKMFLTRIGFGSTAVITGDITQIDLPRGTMSGLKHVLKVLEGVKGIGFTHFHAKDVVRHPLVQRIVEAYEKHQSQENQDTKQHSNSNKTQ